MYKISKLNHHNTNSFDLIPGMAAIRSDDGLTTTARQCHIHVPRHSTCAVYFRSIRPLEIAVHVKRLTLASPRLLTTLPMTSQLRLIGLRFGDLDDQGMSLQKAQSRVCDMRSRTFLHQAHTPVKA